MHIFKNASGLLLLVFCLACSFSAAAQTFMTKASAGKDTFVVGDKIEVKVELDIPPGHIYKLQKMPQLQGLEWLDSAKINRLEQKAGNMAVFSFTAFDSGLYIFPAIDFDIFDADKQIAGSAKTQAISIPVKFAQTDTTQDIKPIKAPMESDYSPVSIWWYVLGIIALMALIYYFYKKWKRKRKKPEIQPETIKNEYISPLQYAEKAILEIQQLQKNESLNKTEYWFGLKEILRSYIAKRYKIQTKEKTSAQLIKNLKNKNTPEAALLDLESVFRQTDMVLFANFSAAETEKNQSAENAVNFIRKSISGKEDIAGKEAEMPGEG